MSDYTIRIFPAEKLDFISGRPNVFAPEDVVTANDKVDYLSGRAWVIYNEEDPDRVFTVPDRSATQKVKVADTKDGVLSDFDSDYTDWDGKRIAKQGLAEPLEIGGKIWPAGTMIEDEYEIDVLGDDGVTYRLVAISVSPVSDTGSPSQLEQIVGFTFDGPWPPAGTTLTYVRGQDENTTDRETLKGHVPCFARGTLIQTITGPVAIADLRVGDLVLTSDHGPQPIRWIGSRLLDAATLAAAPNLRPIRIKANALGEGFPASDLIVSPQHRVLVRSRVAVRMFGADEVLVGAKQLLQLDGIDIATDLDAVEYFHMLFDHHEIVTANGAETESLYTGPEALRSVGAEARKEIFAIFPELEERDYKPEPARPLPSGRMARKMAVRHVRNNKPLVELL